MHTFNFVDHPFTAKEKETERGMQLNEEVRQKLVSDELKS